jgi:Uncharacterized protein conserved in bacteria N-term (DUF3322)
MSDPMFLTLNHRQLGRNRLPDRILVPTETDALKLIGREREARRFKELLKITTAMFPELAALRRLC